MSIYKLRTMSFSANQQAFISTLARETGLNPGVVSAWVAAEEPVGANAGWAGTQNWLNVSITDSGPKAAGNPAWHDPVSAAHLTAQWIKGQADIPGFGKASAGIQAIARTAGQDPATQLRAIQSSGWASGGYPNLGAVYQTYKGNNPSLPAGALQGSANSGQSGSAPMLPVDTRQTIEVPGKVDWTSALLSALNSAGNIKTTGNMTNLHLDKLDPVSKAISAVESGLFTSAPTTQTIGQLQPGSSGTPDQGSQGASNAKPGSGNVIASLFPAGMKIQMGRHDMGRDLEQGQPGAPVLAPGAGHVVSVNSDPGGFGHAYPVVHFDTGPWAGQDIYFGHVQAALPAGAAVKAGQALAHLQNRTGPYVGNAQGMPGHIEIGLASMLGHGGIGALPPGL